MDNKIYNVAIIGCGNMGEGHIKDIYYKDNVCVQVACDLDVKRAEAFQKKYGVLRVETDYMKVVTAPDIDIVIIATYPSSHREILSACIENGKHVICEKPLSDNMQDAEAMVRQIKENPQVKVLIGYILRHNKTYQKVAELIQSGAIGSPIVMRMSQNHHTIDWQKYLRLINETSPLVDCGVHYLDVMQWFTGAKITEVSGMGLRTEADVPADKYNYGLMTVSLSDGSKAFYEAGWGNTFASDNLKEFIGPKGRIKITYQMFRAEHVEEGDLIEYYHYPEGTYQHINIRGNRKPTGEQLNALINMIEYNAATSPTIDEVWQSFCAAVKADEMIVSQLQIR